MGLGARDEYVTFREPNYFASFDYGMFTLNNESYVPRGDDTYTVEVKTLDNFVQLHRIDRVDMLKIDVEGMDVDVLVGARTTIKQHRPKIFIEYTNGIESMYDRVIEELAPYDYQWQQVGNNILAK